MNSKKLISRQELLEGGLTGRVAKQANTLLALIENRTAYLVAQAQAPVELVLTEKAAETRSRAFLAAMALGREPPIRPAIQDLERFASQWALLAPENPTIRATVAHLLGQKYSFTYQAVPGLREALGLDTAAVQQGYQDLYHQRLATIFSPQVELLDRLRWRWSALAQWLDDLPTFWVAFMLTQVIGAVTLALPIAVAGIGPLPGIALIVIIGLINMVTMAAMAETVTRTGNIRFGNAFIGRVAADYLGNISSVIVLIATTAFMVGLLLIFYLGISATLEDATGLWAEVWMALLFLVGLYFLSRGSLNATVALTIVITTINLILLGILALLAFTHFRLEHLLYTNIPLLNGQPFDPSILGVLFGVIVGIYSGHVLFVIFGKMLLQRDPSGRAVIRGHAAGTAFAIIFNSIWVLAVSGAIASPELLHQSGTVLGPLAAQAGSVIHVLGSIFVVLTMGITLIHFSLALFNMVQEQLPSRLADRRARFLLSSTPVILIFLVSEALALTNAGSFAGILGFIGVVVDSLMAGIFPMLLLAASRRKGELVPEGFYRFLGQPILVSVIYLLFLLNLFLHGLLIWQNPVQRVIGILVGLLMMGVTIRMIRRGTFAPRTIIELREDQRDNGQSLVAITSGGRATPGEIALGYPEGEQHIQAAGSDVSNFGSLRYIKIQLPLIPASELKIWAHRITPEGESENLPALVTVHNGSEQQKLDRKLSGGQVILPLKGQANRVEITLAGLE
jgi:amino acid permease